MQLQLAHWLNRELTTILCLYQLCSIHFTRAQQKKVYFKRRLVKLLSVISKESIRVVAFIASNSGFTTYIFIKYGWWFALIYGIYVYKDGCLVFTAVKRKLILV